MKVRRPEYVTLRHALHYGTGGTTSTPVGGGGGTSVGGVDTSQTSTDQAEAQSIQLSPSAMPLGFAGSITASMTASKLELGCALAGRGSVVGISVSGTSTLSGTSANIVLYNKGSATTATLTWSTGTAATQVWPMGTFPFARGDVLDVRVTTDAGFSPSPNPVRVLVFLVLDMNEAI